MAFEIGRITRLELGYVGEGDSRVIEIDMSQWRKRWPDAIFGIVAKRPKETELYIAATETEGDTLSWEITAADVEVEGKGFAQIRAVNPMNGECYMARVVETKIDWSLGGSDGAVVPEASQNWVNQVLLAAQRAEAAADRAENAGADLYGVVDADRNVILFGALKDGEYTFQYDHEDGTRTVIGTLNVVNGGGEDEEPDGPVNVPITWILNMKLNKDTGEVESENDGDYNASDFIEIVPGAQYTIATETDVYNAMNVVYYDANKAFAGYQAYCWEVNDKVENPEEGTPQSCVLEIPEGAAYFRLRQFETWNVQGDSAKYITLTYSLE